ncbi:hypothetical protein QE152_g33277 [Popillia japonica]|uniref:Uncharacterized protein n=1 Tax=Popillia japonica TaxID=7064 RepID=A0AAW1IXL0_POPJA
MNGLFSWLYPDSIQANNTELVRGNGLADSSLPLQAIPNLCHKEDLEKLINSQHQPEPELSNNSDEDEVGPINN